MEKTGTLIMTTQVGDVYVANFLTSQVLDELNVQQLGKELDDLVEKQGIQRLVLNFTKIKFLSSAVLGKLISLNKKVTANKGRIAFSNINADIMQVFKITRLDKLIPIYDEEEDAVKGVGKPGLFGRFR